jgi:hypothetical protein
MTERLDKRGAVRTSEGQDGDLVSRLTGFVCPGRQCMEVVAHAGELRLRVGPASPNDRYVPSADRLLKSVAAAAGAKAIGVILTGMGDDGVEGARFWDGVWWSISLMTTVGWSGQPPHTLVGHLIATVTMVTGFLLLAFTTAVVASLLVREDEEPLDQAELRADREILTEVRALRAELEELRSASRPSDR